MIVIQPLDAMDEPAHLQAVMQVRKQHILPEIHYDPGNPAGEVVGSPGDPETRAYIQNLFPRLPVNDQYTLVPAESTQAPLYYLVTGLIAQIVPPDPQTVLYLGRLVAVLFGATTVYFCWLTARELAPEAPIWATASAGTVALLPSFCFDSAHVSNDSTVYLAATAAFYVWIRGLRNPEFDRRLFGAGAMLGLTLLSKLTAAALIPGLALVILFRMFQLSPRAVGLGNWVKRGLSMIAGAAVGAALVSGWWFVRNIFVYGEPSGTADALRFFIGKSPRADFTRPGAIRDCIRYTLENLWGRFGWNEITLPQEVYRICNSIALVLVALSIVAGIIIIGLWLTRRDKPNIVIWQAWLVFLAVGLTLLAAFIRVNQTISAQPQARYFFILLLPGALLLTGGLYTLAAKRTLRVAAVAILFLGLAVLNTFALVNVSRAGVCVGGVRQNLLHRP